MSTIAENIKQLRDQIDAAAQLWQRQPGQINILAVSKTHPAKAIEQAHAAGQNHFGENYLQEALEKQQQLQHLDLCWHFIGPVQSNKTRQLAENFAWVHSVDRFKIAQRLSRQRPAGLGPLNICVQVNISQEDSKSGCNLSELPQLIEQISQLENLRLRGLMVIPQPCQEFAQQRQPFARTRQAQEQLNRQYGCQMDSLSMGMSADMQAAIAEGSNWLRIGTAIFGQRN